MNDIKNNEKGDSDKFDKIISKDGKDQFNQLYIELIKNEDFNIDSKNEKIYKKTDKIEETNLLNENNYVCKENQIYIKSDKNKTKNIDNEDDTQLLRGKQKK